jgi:cation diffusion facilitator CzcD-associated flavoprotein CzcO
VAIVGSGFSGLGMAIKLKQAGMNDFVVLERADGPGGTWRDNTYPGCQCDVPSNLYSFSFALKPDWSTTFPRQPEIHEYLRGTTTAFGIDRHTRWGHALQDATWREDDRRWDITTSQGALTADVLVLGVGPLAEPCVPAIAGFDRFEGKVFHSARWDHEHDLNGERVAVIGTGASAIQIVPSIQPQVGHLDLYQRTPAWVMPHPDRPVTRFEKRLFRALPITQKALRALIYLGREVVAVGMSRRPAIMKAIERVGRAHLAKQVPDPALRKKLTPRYELGCKRILLSNTYYPALAQPNVDVVTAGVAEVRAHAIVDTDGIERPVDTIVLATGFHVTDSPTYQLIHGKDGRTLLDAFDDHGAYLGTTAHGFPNLFVLAGPNTGIGHTSLVYMIESQLAYVLDGLRTMDRLGVATVEVGDDEHTRFFEEMQRRSEGTVWASGCSSWYLDRHGRNATLWPDCTFIFRRRTRRFDMAAYHAEARAAMSSQAVSG